jgi:hypothetical protein
MAPELKLTVVDLAKTRAAVYDAAADRLEQCNVIFAQPRSCPSFGRLSASALPAEKAIFFPPFGFVGFHPDMFRPQKKFGYTSHSAVLAAAYLLGMPPDRAIDLLNAYVFGRLGYMCYQRACDKTVASFAERGFDISGEFSVWLRDGAFMHTAIHPKIRVLWSVGRLFLDRLGIAADAAAPMPEDMLNEEAYWPIYPEIARQAGVPAITTVKLTTGQILGLDEFAEWCFRFYRKMPAADLRQPPVTTVEQILAAEIR